MSEHKKPFLSLFKFSGKTIGAGARGGLVSSNGLFLDSSRRKRMIVIMPFVALNRVEERPCMRVINQHLSDVIITPEDNKRDTVITPEDKKLDTVTTPEDHKLDVDVVIIPEDHKPDAVITHEDNNLVTDKVIISKNNKLDANVVITPEDHKGDVEKNPETTQDSDSGLNKTEEEVQVKSDMFHEPLVEKEGKSDMIKQFEQVVNRAIINGAREEIADLVEEEDEKEGKSDMIKQFEQEEVMKQRKSNSIKKFEQVMKRLIINGVREEQIAALFPEDEEVKSEMLQKLEQVMKQVKQEVITEAKEVKSEMLQKLEQVMKQEVITEAKVSSNFSLISDLVKGEISDERFTIKTETHTLYWDLTNQTFEPAKDIVKLEQQISGILQKLKDDTRYTIRLYLTVGSVQKYTSNTVKRHLQTMMENMVLLKRLANIIRIKEKVILEKRFIGIIKILNQLLTTYNFVEKGVNAAKAKALCYSLLQRLCTVVYKDKKFNFFVDLRRVSNIQNIEDNAHVLNLTKDEFKKVIDTARQTNKKKQKQVMSNSKFKSKKTTDAKTLQ